MDLAKLLIKLNDSMNFFSKLIDFPNTCCKFLMCITYSFLSCKFATSLSTISIFIRSGKKRKSF